MKLLGDKQFCDTGGVIKIINTSNNCMTISQFDSLERSFEGMG